MLHLIPRMLGKVQGAKQDAAGTKIACILCESKLSPQERVHVYHQSIQQLLSFGRV